jgi:GT2 family glycosyltransferase
MVQVGVVVIGRNEGERLRRCLTGLQAAQVPIVYVDSGSSDGSVSFARSLGVEVVELDLTLPFTAGRARNEGYRRLLVLHPTLEYVQFVDGDAEVASGWLERAARELEDRPDVAVASGRQRERFPNASVYNQVCDLEWDTPVGEVRAVLGSAMVRVQAFNQVGGFDPRVIAAEDDELCLRLRQRGWKIWRVHAEMTLHDAAMHRFGQWYQRAVRCGYAYALGASMHGGSRDRHFVRETLRICLWGFLLPALILLTVLPTYGLSLLLGLIYPLQVARIYWRTRRRAQPGPALVWAVSCVASKFPEFVGLCRLVVGRLHRRPARIIEYKSQ